MCGNWRVTSAISLLSAHDRFRSRRGRFTQRAKAGQIRRPHRPGEDPDCRPGHFRITAHPHVIRPDAWQLGVLRFLLGAADGALLPAVQTLLVYNSTNQIAGRIFSYNQSFRDIGNVTGPLMGAAISANYGFRAVFCVTAGVVLFNALYSWNSLRRRRETQRTQ